MASKSYFALGRETKELQSTAVCKQRTYATEAKLEIEILRRRKEIIENGTSRTRIRIRDPKFYEKIGETWQEVEISKNENLGN